MIELVNQYPHWRVDAERMNVFKTVKKTTIHSRDPFTVVILESIFPDKTKIVGVGCSKRARYGKIKDEPNLETGIKIARDRAIKDIVRLRREQLAITKHN